MLGYRVGFIGVGNMASAILNGALRQSVVRAENVYLFDVEPEKMTGFRGRGAHVAASGVEVAQAVDLLVLAVKPQKFDQVLAELAGHVEGKCVVSIAAGISSETIKRALPGAYVIRVMPNTPLLLGKGMTALARAEDVPEGYRNAVNDLFAAAGETVVVDEAQINAVIALSGSSPAYFFRIAAAMAREGEAMGLPADTALQLVSRAMEGSAAMLLKSGKSAQELTRQVCSPGGTTLAALTAFDDLDMDGLMAEAMRRCVRRAEELGQ